MLTPQAESLLAERRIDLETALRYGLRSPAENAGGECWLEIPYFVGTETVNCKRRTLCGPKKFYQDAAARKCFWNFNALTDTALRSEKLVICEGEMDALAAIQSGFLRTVSVPDGAPAKAIGDKDSAKYSFLDDAMPLLKDVTEIIIAADGDEPGVNLLNDLALRLGKTRCKWVKYPLRRGSKERCKDLNEVLVQYGERGVTECINRAEFIYTDGVYRTRSLPPVPRGDVLKIGLPGLDDMYRIRKGDFVVVTGVPGDGKTSLLTDIACRMAVNHGWRTCFASFEQCPQTDHMEALTAWHDGMFPMGDADEWTYQHFVFMIPGDNDLPNLEWVLDRCEMAVIQHQCDMLVIDPWNELDHTRPEGMTLTEYTGYAIKQFKRLARKLKVHFILAAHPAKMKRDDLKNGPPTLYDISDSAHFANKADIGLTVFRPNKEVNETMIVVSKVRYQNLLGKPGTAKMQYLWNMRRYECIET